MSKSTVRSVALPQALIDAVETYRAAHGWRSWNYALLHLVVTGLAARGIDVATEDNGWGGKRQK